MVGGILALALAQKRGVYLLWCSARGMEICNEGMGWSLKESTFFILQARVCHRVDIDNRYYE